MGTQVLSANDSLMGYYGGEQLFVYPFRKMEYTEGIRKIAKNTESYWFLDIIASYQTKFQGDFQVWTLEREYSYSVVDGVRVVGKRKNCFNVVCEDGNDNVLVTQHIPYSDFPYDLYTVWCANGILYLPVEH